MQSKMKLTDVFDRIYVINLDSRVDRLAEISGQLKRLSLTIDEVKIHRFSAIAPPDAGNFPSIGSRGCFLSHLQVLEDALESKLSTILILEDDADFIEQIDDLLPTVLVKLRDASAWDVFYGGYQLEEPLNNSDVRTCSLIYPTIVVRTTHCIGLTSKAIEMAVPYLTAMCLRPLGSAAGGPMHVDGAYSWFRKDNPHLRTIVSRPEIAIQRASRSDIADIRWFDRHPALHSIVSTLRKFKQSLKRARK
jgi:glycosyl transferase, family 25